MQQDVTVKIGEELMGLHKTGNVEILYGQSMDTVIPHTKMSNKQNYSGKMKKDLF